jgi:hypothetical protein
VVSLSSVAARLLRYERTIDGGERERSFAAAVRLIPWEELP